MEAKELNRRIAMAMLKQCELVWEMGMESHKKGEFTMSDVMDGLSIQKDEVKNCKTGRLTFIRDFRKDDFFAKKLLDIEETDRYHDFQEVTIKVCTDENNPNVAFECTYDIEDVFWRCYEFCKAVGCHSILKHVVFGYDADGRWTRLPEPRMAKVSKPKRKDLA